jgi:prepilin-type N-terminal cleavage/methylation domain-containing protein
MKVEELLLMTNFAAENQVAISVRAKRAAGFTLVEILIVVAIVAILSSISFPVYKNYIEKAKVTVAINTLESVRKAMEIYYIDSHLYPAALDFASGLDGQGHVVLPPDQLADFNRNIFSVESYSGTTAEFTLVVRAIDSKHTLLTLTSAQGIVQGP